MLYNAPLVGSFSAEIVPEVIVTAMLMGSAAIVQGRPNIATMAKLTTCLRGATFSPRGKGPRPAEHEPVSEIWLAQFACSGMVWWSRTAQAC